MRVRARILSAEAIPTIVLSSSMSFEERRTRSERLPMPFDEKIRDYLDSIMREVLYSPKAHFSQFPIVRAQVPIHPGHSVLFHPNPTLGESALLSAHEAV